MSEPTPDALDLLAQEAVNNRQIDRTAALMDESLAVNLDEVTDTTLKVKINDDGVWRAALISTYVPMRIFNEMMKSRNRMILKQRNAQADDPDADDPNLAWMLENVLKVWQRSENDMTLDRLQDGLTFKQIQSLFFHFFGDLIQTRGSKATTGGNGTGVSAPSADAPPDSSAAA